MYIYALFVLQVTWRLKYMQGSIRNHHARNAKPGITPRTRGLQMRCVSNVIDRRTWIADSSWKPSHWFALLMQVCIQIYTCITHFIFEFLLISFYCAINEITALFCILVATNIKISWHFLIYVFFFIRRHVYFLYFRFCDKKFWRTKERNAHEAVHSDVKHKCHICTKEFNMKENLKSHIKNVHHMGTPHK